MALILQVAHTVTDKNVITIKTYGVFALDLRLVISSLVYEVSD